MSGPKVVRIVTREEILEICRGHLARVDAALAEWTRTGRRNDCIDVAALATANHRREALATLIVSDRFADLQKQAPLEEVFLREDMQTRLTAMAAKQAAARSRGRREREAAATLLRTLRSSGLPIDSDLIERLERGDASALAQGFQLLADGAAKISGASLEAAAHLRGEVLGQTLADWLSKQPSPPMDPATERVESRLDALAVHVRTDAIANWRARLDEAASAPSARRALLLDGLEIDTGRALTSARHRSKAINDLALTVAELEAAGLEFPVGPADVDLLDVAEILARTTEVRAALNEHRAVQAANARRSAVLKGLAELGYEVAEGMSTTWVTDGRLVLRSSARPDYGVEVSGRGDGGRIQMRAVAFDANGNGPEPSRDRDAETIWCGDVTGLQERLSKIGGALVIERARPIGATPLKRIVVDTPNDPGTGIAAPRFKQRSLR